MNDVTNIINDISQFDPQAASRLLPLVYNELRRLSAQRLAQEKTGQTLQVSAIVHEAYLRLIGGNDQGQDLDGRSHFFAAMRRTLIEYARSEPPSSMVDRRGGSPSTRPFVWARTNQTSCCRC
jgi:hypothetical protein